jgi:hypothetical protein
VAAPKGHWFIKSAMTWEYSFVVAVCDAHHSRSTIYCFANHSTVVPGGAVPALGPAEWAALFFRERIDVNVQSR